MGTPGMGRWGDGYTWGWGGGMMGTPGNGEVG